MGTQNRSYQRGAVQVANGAISPSPPVSRELRESDAPHPPGATPQGVVVKEVVTIDPKRGDAPFHQQGQRGETANDETAGRPEAWRVSPSEVSQVLTFVQCGYSLRQAAGLLGRSHSTFVKLRRRDPKFDHDYRQRREMARDKPLSQIRSAAERSWRAAAWLLKYLDAQERGAKQSGRAKSQKRRP